jgi:hypothetical protein
VISRMTRAALALVLGLGLALLASSQTPSRVATPAVSPTRTIPSTVLTPGSGGVGAGSVTSSTTPGYGSNLYSIPATTPQGVPAYQTTPTAAPVGSTGPMITAAPKRPLAAADCAQNGWQSYAGLGFTDQKGCEAWVKRHPAGSSRAAAGAKKMRTAAPASRLTPGAASPMEASTPGSSITPLLNPTTIPK